MLPAQAEMGGGGTQVLQVPFSPWGLGVDINVAAPWPSHDIYTPEALKRNRKPDSSELCT